MFCIDILCTFLVDNKLKCARCPQKNIFFPEFIQILHAAPKRKICQANVSITQFHSWAGFGNAAGFYGDEKNLCPWNRTSRKICFNDIALHFIATISVLLEHFALYLRLNVSCWAWFFGPSCCSLLGIAYSNGKGGIFAMLLSRGKLWAR